MNTQVASGSFIDLWKGYLKRLLQFYDSRRWHPAGLFIALFAFFCLINGACYWWGMLTIFPKTVFGQEKTHYFLLQFPVAILGAVFDSCSFYVTVYICRRAISTTSAISYIAHLSIDLVIAVIATWWVLFVFSFSGWIISQFEDVPETLQSRNAEYRMRVVSAARNPMQKDNRKNIYFGVIMGVSAMLPTCMHLAFSGYAAFRYFWTSYVATRPGRRGVP